MHFPQCLSGFVRRSSRVYIVELSCTKHFPKHDVKLAHAMNHTGNLRVNRKPLPERFSGSTTSTAVEGDDTDSSLTPISHDEYVGQQPGHRDANYLDQRTVSEIFEALNTEVDRRTYSIGPEFEKGSDTLNSDEPAKFGHLSIDARDEERATLGPPPPVDIWHKDLAHTRKDVFRRYTTTLLTLCVAIFAILSIYWGVLFNVKKLLPNITVAVVSFEGTAPYQNYQPIVGPFVRAACEAEMASRYDHLGYTFQEPSQYGNDPANVRLAVYNQDIWAAIIVNANATALLQQAVETGNVSYDPRGAMTIVYNQARDVESYNFHIVPFLDSIAVEIMTTFATSWAQRVLANTSLSQAVYSRVPQAVSPGISFTSLNLRPFDPPVAIPTITIGLIYLIIIAFFSFTFFIPTHMKFVLPNPMYPHPPLKFYQLVMYRWAATILAYFFLALSYSLVSLAFQIPFSNSPPAGSPLNVNGDWTKTEPVVGANPYGHATWLVYFLLNFIGMAALGLTCENMAMLLSVLSPLPFSALFLIWWVIANVSTGFYALELASDFYRWGYAWPLRQIVQGSKTLVFGTKNELRLNFGVLFAWIFVGTLLFPIACWVMRWGSIRDKKKAKELQRKVEEKNSL